MKLLMKITSFQRLTPDQVVYHRFTKDGGSIGRSTDCDWMLPDPDKVISKKHATITYIEGQFRITDNSTNGVYVNNADEAIGKGNFHTFERGDNIRLGDYEILIDRISQNDEPAIFDDNVANIEDSRQSKESTKSAQVVKIAPTARETRTATGNDAFSPPSMLLPDDWNMTDLDILDNQDSLEEINDVAKPTETVVINVNENALQKTSTKPTSLENKPIQQSGALEAFAKGLGLKDSENLDNAVMQKMGESLRDALAGMLDVMATRSAMKGEFRVMQTMIRSSENNPIKFSVDVDEVIQNLFLRDISGFLQPKEAISEAFKDLNTHEIALMNAVQAAMRSALQELSPDAIKSKPFTSLGLKKIWPGAQKVKYWNVFEHSHNEINKDILDGQNQYMNDEFAKAYEEKLQELNK